MSTTTIQTGDHVGIKHPDGGYADSGSVSHVIDGEWVVYHSENNGGEHEVHVSVVVKEA